MPLSHERLFSATVSLHWKAELNECCGIEAISFVVKLRSFQDVKRTMTHLIVNLMAWFNFSSRLLSQITTKKKVGNWSAVYAATMQTIGQETERLILDGSWAASQVVITLIYADLFRIPSHTARISSRSRMSVNTFCTGVSWRTKRSRRTANYARFLSSTLIY